MYEKIFSSIIGYFFGCFLTAEIVAKKYAGKSAAELGDTGNPGMANIMASLGFVPGILTLAGDLGKCILAGVLSYVFFRAGGTGQIAVLYAGLGCTLGHDFPFWRHFRGGKGVATTSMAIILYAFWPGLTANIAGMFVVFITKYLCIGGPVIPLAFALIMFLQGHTEPAVIGLLLTCLSVYCHSGSMRGIRSGTTRKTDVLRAIGRKWLVIPLIVIVTLLSVCFTYLSDYYHASAYSRQLAAGGGLVLAAPDSAEAGPEAEPKAEPEVGPEAEPTTEPEADPDPVHKYADISRIPEGLFLDGPGTENAIIFYPGGKVEYTAYTPLLYALASDGIDCFLVKMPFNIAFTGKNKASGIMLRYKYKSWFLGGHSLGGVAASMYASEHPLPEAAGPDGLILLASYPTAALSMPVLELYGSEDDVLNHKRFKESESYLPAGSRIEVIEGGNHAQFGDYGVQKGDGTALITREEQQKQTISLIESFIHQM